MKQVNVNHHKQQTGCLKFSVPVIVVTIVMYLLKIPVFSISSIIPGVIIYLFLFKGIPLIWQLLLKSNFKKYIPSKFQNILPEKKVKSDVFSVIFVTFFNFSPPCQCDILPLKFSNINGFRA